MYGDEVSVVESFKYLWNCGDIVEGMMHRIKCGRIKWIEASGVLCDKEDPDQTKR